MGMMFKAFGGWLLLDGIASIVVYYGQPHHSGRKQTWARDHWLRAARAAIGIALIVWGE